MLTVNDFECAVNNAAKKIAPFGDTVVKDLSLDKDTKLFFVGGLVRDAVLGELFGKQTEFKDMDIMLSKFPDLKNNSNITWMRKNSLGGIKLKTKNIGIMDIFQQRADSVSYVQYVVGDTFDFNCNSIYYYHNKKQIKASNHFYDFIVNNKIGLEKFVYTKDGFQCMYSPHSVVSRALKFKIKFSEQYGINVNLSGDILLLLYHLDNDEEQKMFDYTKRKVASPELQKKIIDEYKKLRC